MFWHDILTAEYQLTLNAVLMFVRSVSTRWQPKKQVVLLLANSDPYFVLQGVTQVASSKMHLIGTDRNVQASDRVPCANHAKAR